MDKSNIVGDYNVVSYLLKDGDLTPRSALVVSSFTMRSSFKRVVEEADKRFQPVVRALECCNSVPWKCVFTIISHGSYVTHTYRRYLINYSSDEMPF